MAFSLLAHNQETTSPTRPIQPRIGRLRTSPLMFKFNYERFNHNNFTIHFWSWNYRGCWHQTCPPIDFIRFFMSYSFPQPSPFRMKDELIVVTTSFVLRLGNFRACCLPWKWQPSLKLPLRCRTLIPRYPLSPW